MVNWTHEKNELQSAKQQKRKQRITRGGLLWAVGKLLHHHDCGTIRWRDCSNQGFTIQLQDDLLAGLPSRLDHQRRAVPSTERREGSHRPILTPNRETNMSAQKKRTPLRWKCSNERTESGHVFCTNWTATLGKFSLLVTNYAGSRTLSWRISVPGSEWWQGSDEDRFEFTVSTLKDKVYRRAMGMIASELQDKINSICDRSA